MKRILTVLSILWISLGIADARQKKVLIMPVEINSLSFTSSREELDSLVQQCSRYFQTLQEKYPGEFELAPIIRLTNGRYNTQSAQAAVIEAYRQCSKMLDLQTYDKNIGVIFSGGEIWPHEMLSTNFEGSYFVVSEYFEGKAIGTGMICHEYGHILGLKDLYDSDEEQSGGKSKGLWGRLALMDKGERNDGMNTPAGLCALDYHLLGIGDCDTLSVGDYVLEPINRSGRYLYMPTDKLSEYYLFETRVQEDWDAYIGGEGMLIYHIDASTNKAGYSSYYDKVLSAQQRWELNQVNCRPDHPCARLLEAIPDADTVSKVFFPAVEGQSISSESSPNLGFWSGGAAELALKNIRRLEDGSVSFKVIRPIGEAKIMAFQTSALLTWSLDEFVKDDFVLASIVVSSENAEEILIEQGLNDVGGITLNIDGLKSNSLYKVELKVHCKNEDYSQISYFKTHRIDERNTIPFILTEGLEKKRIPLQVFNSYDALEIRWSFNGESISVDSEGFFTIPGSGVLRAELLYEDGSIDVINKEIR